MVSEKVKAEENKKSSSSFLKKKKPIKSSLSGSRPEPLKKKKTKIDEDKDKKTVIEWNSSVSVSKEQVLNKKSEKEVENKSSSSFLKKKPTNTKNAVSRKAILIAKPLKKKEIESEKLDLEWNSSVAISKDQVSKKRKNIKTEKEEVVEVKKQKEKKVYDIAGQKRDQPDERDPLRIFYETLYKEVPTCKMAQIWLMESGLLPDEKAKEDVEKSGKSSSLAKSAASTARANSKPVTVKKDAKKSSALLSKKKISDLKPTAKKKRKNEQEGDLLASRASKISKTK